MKNKTHVYCDLCYKPFDGDGAVLYGMPTMVDGGASCEKRDVCKLCFYGIIQTDWASIHDNFKSTQDKIDEKSEQDK